MNKTLRYSDLKGRTDLVGRKVLLKADDEIYTITAIDEDAFFVAPNIKQFFTTQLLELLDEEPARLVSTQWDSLEGQTHSYNDGCGHPAHNDPTGAYEGVPMKGNPVDTRTEITWENATLDDYISFQNIDGKKSMMTIRAYLQESGHVSLAREKKMTLSQIEEKLGHKVEIVE